jgi:FkbM family methyltransferase
MVPILLARLNGNTPHCSWRQALETDAEARRFLNLRHALESTLTVATYDAEVDADLIISPNRQWWIDREGLQGNSKQALAYLLAEQEWMTESNPVHAVRGGIVLDCGAGIGSFTDAALRLGADLVVSIEPSPVAAELLRRNFSDEIATQRVIIVQEGVWSSPGWQKLSLDSSSMVVQGDRSVEARVTTIDDIVRDLDLSRVDYIKMDIEGAEREALKGAMETLRTFRPRLMLESYHLPDDMTVLPAIVRQAHGDYQLTCGPCEMYMDRLVPHVTYWE